MAEEEKSPKTLVEAATKFFGFSITDKESEKNLKTFVPPAEDDGSSITYSGYGSYFPTVVDFSGTKEQNENNMIMKYRSLALAPECENAIDDICNEAIVVSERSYPVDIVLDDVDEKILPKKTKELVKKEFMHILKLLDFKNSAYEIFRKWYIDGRLHYHIMIDEENQSKGIQELRYVDARKIRRFKEKQEKKQNTLPSLPGDTKSYMQPKYVEYFLFNEKGFEGNPKEGLRIKKDSIAYISSGIIDYKSGTIMSQLHKSIKPYNQLRMLEDAVVIYRLARAPERRIFKIDVGGIPPSAAEKYMNNMVQRMKNKLSYDVNSGEIINERKFMTMMEDFFLPQREGRGTEVDTLPGGQNLGEMEDVEYFKKRLYKALNVPVSRLEAETTFNLGRASEITRDELKFTKFIQRQRIRFSSLFEQLLEKQLILKNILTIEDFKQIKQDILYDYKEDNHFTELKNDEVFQNRLTILDQAEQYQGKYFPKEWMMKQILRFTDDEIEELKKQMEGEEKDEPDSGYEIGTGQADFQLNPPVPELPAPGSGGTDKVNTQGADDRSNNPAVKNKVAASYEPEITNAEQELVENLNNYLEKAIYEDDSN